MVNYGRKNKDVFYKPVAYKIDKTLPVSRVVSIEVLQDHFIYVFGFRRISASVSHRTAATV